MQLQALTSLQLERFYAELLDEGGRGGQRLAPKTVRNTHVVLRRHLLMPSGSASCLGTQRRLLAHPL